MATYREAAVNLMTRLATEGRGYELKGGHSWTNLVTYDVYGVSVGVPAGSMDCSGAVSAVYKALGLLDKGTIYDTGNMEYLMCDTGYFTWHSWDDPYVMRPGDLMLKPKPSDDAIGHVAMCIANDFSLAEFTTDNVGGPGVRGFYDFPWTVCLELNDSIGNQTWSGSSTGGSGTGGPIAEDGVWGKATTAAMQRHYGTVADGEVWHQWRPNIDANPVLGEGWMCDETLLGSPVIRALQSDLGVSADGIMGPATISAIYDLFGGAYGHSTTLSAAAVWEIQHQLNGDVWPLHL